MGDKDTLLVKVGKKKCLEVSDEKCWNCGNLCVKGAAYCWNCGKVLKAIPKMLARSRGKV
ncbi:MAG: hypothetical protein ABIG91_00210 [Patescibacteria group bacterium]